MPFRFHTTVSRALRPGLNLIGYLIDHENYKEAANMLYAAAEQCEALEGMRQSWLNGEHLLKDSPAQNGSQDVLREDAP